MGANRLSPPPLSRLVLALLLLLAPAKASSAEPGDSELTRKPSWNLGLSVVGGGLSAGTVFDLEPATYGLPAGAAGISARIIPASQLGDKFGYKITNASNYLHGITAADVKGAVVLASRGGGGYTGKTGACATVGAAACLVYDTALPYGQVGMIGIAPPTKEPAYITSLDAGNAIEAAAAGGAVVTAAIAGSGPVATGDRIALEAVYDAMSKGDEWAFGAKFYGVYQLRGAGVEHWSWMKSHPGEDICNNGTRLWGAWCEGGRVTMISGLQWQYQTTHSWSLPDAFGQLTGLKKLLFSSLYGVGALPDTLGSMSSLVFLDISRNALSGDLPCSMGGMTNLEYLQIRSNKFTGISSCVGGGSEGGATYNGTKKLRFVWADENQFDSMPDSFTQLPSVVVFAMSKNRLANLPAVNSMAAVKVLDVSFNLIRTPMPSFAGLSQLVTLDLSENRFSGSSHAAAFDHMAALEKLVLRNNALEGPMPNFAFTTALTEVDATNNTFSSLPVTWNKLVKLKSLKLSQNHLLSPVDMLATLPDLVTIDLSHNRLTTNTSEADKGGLGNWFLHASFPDSTESLDLSHNDLHGVLCPDVDEGGDVDKCTARPGHFTKLIKLVVSHNPKLGGRFPLILLDQNGPKLEHCDFSYNDLAGALPKFITAPATYLSFEGNPRLTWANAVPANIMPSWSKSTGVFSAAPGEKYSCPIFKRATVAGAALVVSSSYYEHSLCTCNRGYYDRRDGPGVDCVDFPATVTKNTTRGSLGDAYGALSAGHERLQAGLRTSYTLRGVTKKVVANVSKTSAAKAMAMVFTNLGLSGDETVAVYEGASSGTPVWSIAASNLTAAGPASFFVLGDAATVAFSSSSADNARSFNLTFTAQDACPLGMSVAGVAGACVHPAAKVGHSIELPGFTADTFKNNEGAFIAAIEATANVPARVVRIIRTATSASRALAAAKFTVHYELWAPTGSDFNGLKAGAETVAKEAAAFASSLKSNMASATRPAAWATSSTPGVTFPAPVSVIGLCLPGTEFYSGAAPRSFCAANPEFAKAVIGSDESCCSPCAAGRFQPYESNTMVCQECAAGQFASSPGQSRCESCSPVAGLKTATHTEDFKGCQCAAGLFGTADDNMPFKLHCTPCPEGVHCPVTQIGITIDTVEASTGYWLERSFFGNDPVRQRSLRAEKCNAASDGTNWCMGGAYSLAAEATADANTTAGLCTDEQAKRSAAADQTCVTFLESIACARASCQWDPAENNCRATHDMTSCGCQEGHYGVMCTQCLDGFTMNIYQSCESCSSDNFADIVLPLFFGAILVVAMMMAVLHRRFMHLAEDLHELKDRMLYATVWVKLTDIDQQMRLATAVADMLSSVNTDIVYAMSESRAALMTAVGFFQVLSQYVILFPVAWPSLFVNLTVLFDSVIQVLRLDFLAMGCISSMTFLDNFMLFTGGCTFLCGCFFMVMLFAHARYKMSGAAEWGGVGNKVMNHWLHLRRKGLKGVCFILFMTYPSLCRCISTVFVCSKLPDGNWYLDADRSIVCAAVPANTVFFGSALNWTDYRNVAVLFTMLYILGVPLLFLAILWKHKEDMYHEDEKIQHATQEEIGFLFHHYKKEYWYFEVVDLIRKLLLTSVVVFIYPDTPMQLVVGSLMALAIMVVYAKLSPLHNRRNDFIQIMCQGAIFFSLFSALLFKVGSRDGSVMWVLVDALLGIFTILPIALVCLLLIAGLYTHTIVPLRALRRHDRALHEAQAAGFSWAVGATRMPIASTDEPSGLALGKSDADTALGMSPPSKIQV